ncbi:Shedu anti-phage system protein SduA domain-containing protein [Flavobacterium sp. W1B]|uniref:Shedu anti-phage system protein SduA domain-containing protein n=1 Tax=Flavobacterium sp. W1B TaxID=3394146 RepID=UPI0039BD5477
MSLFDKDYTKLSHPEQEALEKIHNKEEGSFLIRDFEKLSHRLEVYRNFPFVLNYDSLFPKNHLNTVELATSNIKNIAIVQKFSALLSTEITERDILNFIRDNRAYFIIGSILLNYTIYGHHDRYIFPEIELPPNFQADFLLIGKNSNGYHFLLIELENPTGNITLADGNFGNAIRKGLNQIDDWRDWLENNFNGLRKAIEKLNIFNKQLPKEFYEFDSTRFEYAVIAGRRSDYNDKSNRLKRKLRRNGVFLLHYDNLIEESEKLIKSGNY